MLLSNLSKNFIDILRIKQEGDINDLLAGRQVYMPLKTTRVIGNDLKQGNNGDIKVQG